MICCSYKLPMRRTDHLHPGGYVIRFKQLTIAVVLFGVASLAHAIPIQWRLDGVAFNDGTLANGSFVFDASEARFSDLLISTAGFTYTTDERTPLPRKGSIGIQLIDGFVPNDNIGKSIFNLDFLSVLTDAGGLVNLRIGFPSFEGRCSSADCTAGQNFRVVTAGSLIGTPIPEPGLVALMVIGLGGMVLVRQSHRTP
jgi:hypothetical protein